MINIIKTLSTISIRQSPGRPLPLSSWLLVFDAKVATSEQPKRQLREARKQTQNRGVGTKSQQALKRGH
ncbi:MAG: DUF2992 family protein [Bacteroidales bacterium]|nr:DUF2992 family protein [Bacteroidales bacterium]